MEDRSTWVMEDLDQDLVVRAMRETDAVRMNTSAPVPRPVPRVDIWMDDLSSTFANGLRVVRAATCAHRCTVWLICERDTCSVRPPSHSLTDLWERFIIIEDLTMWARQFECLWNNLSGPPKHACILCGKTGHAKGACVVLGAVLHRKLNSSRDVVEIILRMLCDWSEVHYDHQITCLRYRPGGMYI